MMQGENAAGKRGLSASPQPPRLMAVTVLERFRVSRLPLASNSDTVGEGGQAAHTPRTNSN